MHKPTKADLLEAMIEEPDGSDVMIWGHGGEGYTYVNDSDTIHAEDLAYVAAERKRRGKGKLGHLWIRSCNTCRSAKFVNAAVDCAKDVFGFTTITTDGPIQHWSAHVDSDPPPRYWFPWHIGKKVDKKKKKKAKLPHG